MPALQIVDEGDELFEGGGGRVELDLVRSTTARPKEQEKKHPFFESSNFLITVFFACSTVIPFKKSELIRVPFSTYASFLISKSFSF